MLDELHCKRHQPLIFLNCGHVSSTNGPLRCTNLYAFDFQQSNQCRYTQVSCFRYLQDSFSVIIYALFNILSVVTIIVANKAVFKTINFHFPTVLMCVHTAVTFLGLSVRFCMFPLWFLFSVNCARLLSYFTGRKLSGFVRAQVFSIHATRAHGDLLRVL